MYAKLIRNACFEILRLRKGRDGYGRGLGRGLLEREEEVGGGGADGWGVDASEVWRDQTCSIDHNA